MSNAATKINQIDFIDRILSKGGRYTPQEISELLDEYGRSGGTSVKTVYRLLDKMKKEFHAPIVVDSQNRRYYSNDKTVMLPGYIARAENFHFIEIVKNLLETLKGTPIYDEAEKVFTELSIFAPTKSARNQSNSDSAPARVVFLGAPAADVQDSIWNTIFTAMEKSCHIVIEYEMPGQESIKRGIRPYQLIFDNGIWDLWGYDCVNRRPQLYNLCRIKKIELRDEYFDLPEDYQFKNVTPGTFGCYRDLDKTSMTHYKIHFRHGSYAETYAKDRVWGLNPYIEEDETGTIISFENNQSAPILRWILGWGADVKPMEPSELVRDWKEEIKKMYGEVK